jgi:glyoxylate utilization-related uncharacterized protein
MAESGGVLVNPVTQNFSRRFMHREIASEHTDHLAFDELDVHTWNGGELAMDGAASHFVIVLNGHMDLDYDNKRVTMSETWYGVFPGEVQISGQGAALIISSVNYAALPLFGGPLEQDGRLRYVDGCTNSLLIAPPVCGEPCLNFLNLPAGTYQTPHTHPTIRVGMVVSGHGGCGTAENRLVFEPGSVFIIPPDALHSFQTDDEHIRIMLFHPDSVVGPTHTDQTMLNNTFVDGASAKDLTQLHTREETSA